MADLLCCLIAAIPSGNKTHPAAELEAGHQEFELVVRKPTPDAELGFVMTVGASPKVGSLSPDGLAASAGLHIGDRIRKVNEARVDTDDTALLAIRNAQTQRPNDPVTLTVSRYMSKGPLVLREVTLPSGALGVVFEAGSTKVKELREGSALRGLVHPGERIVAFAWHAQPRGRALIARPGARA